MSDSRQDFGPLDVGDVRIPGQRFESSIYVWERPAPDVERYTLVNDDGIASAHSGRAVSLDRVIGFERNDDPETNGLRDPEEGSDLAVFDRHHRIAAIIRRHHDRPDEVIRIPAPEREGRSDA